MTEKCTDPRISSNKSDPFTHLNRNKQILFHSKLFQFGVKKSFFLVLCKCKIPVTCVSIYFGYYLKERFQFVEKDEWPSRNFAGFIVQLNRHKIGIKLSRTVKVRLILSKNLSLVFILSSLWILNRGVFKKSSSVK